MHGRAIRGTLKEEKELMADSRGLYSLTKGQHFGSAAEKVNDMGRTLEELDQHIEALRKLASDKRVAYSDKLKYATMIEEAKAQRRKAASSMLEHNDGGDSHHSDTVARARADLDLRSIPEKLGFLFGKRRKRVSSGDIEAVSEEGAGDGSLHWE
ncbi:hypothetical protein DMB44_04280 [Thermoplasma sp. Kam2015]|uniref:hypothetical protein n=1 Tax=Thermoplasma sp. Kam2015 TaxID=2094122 RepID=UPI000D89FFDD|nr:hypothetical protein [Thermoplasma sp. Kam2015]PYB68558.1 hypothetical protein DMB44_04280 [Thermoplasma sp. Kam2015]